MSTTAVPTAGWRAASWIRFRPPSGRKFEAAPGTRGSGKREQGHNKVTEDAQELRPETYDVMSFVGWRAAGWQAHVVNRSIEVKRS